MSQPHHLITTGVIVHDAKPDSKPNQFVISAGFAKLWNWILNRLSDQPQLKICQKRDRQGNLYWQVYDPTRNYCIQLDSELEVRSWIEKLHQQ